MASAYGHYLEAGGIPDRATVFVDAGGTVRYAASVIPAGARDIPVLVDEMIALAGQYGGEMSAPAALVGLPSDAKLFVKDNCGFSKAVLAVHKNLHLEERLPIENVSKDAAAMAALQEASGNQQAPCLVIDDKALLESKDIIRALVEKTTGFN